VTGLIRAVRPHERDTALGGLRGELTAGVSPYLPAGSRRRDGANGPAASAPVSRSASFRGAQLKRVGRAVRGEHRVQAHPPEISRMRGNSGNKYRSRLPATARNLQSDATPMIARAVQSVTTSASVTLLFLAHHLFHEAFSRRAHRLRPWEPFPSLGRIQRPEKPDRNFLGTRARTLPCPLGFRPRVRWACRRSVAWRGQDDQRTHVPPAAEIVGAARHWRCPATASPKGGGIGSPPGDRPAISQRQRPRAQR
jgi:hypothetical protein